MVERRVQRLFAAIPSPVYGRLIGRYARTVLLGAVLVVVAVGRASGHGDASWIMDHPDHGWCCGPQDCFWLDPDEVRIDGDHYVVDRFSIRWPVIGAFRSAAHRYWACTFMRGSSEQQLKCFFAPPPPAM